MKQSYRLIAAAVSLAALYLCGSVALAEEASKPKNLNNYLCKDVMRMSGDDRDIAIALLHGYRLGKKNTTEFQTEVLAVATDNFIEYCLDNPQEKALESFDKFTK